ncbi:hypothetical protein [Streptosporangium sp. NPDC051022]
MTQQRGQWPAGANEVKPGKKIYTCKCGAMSTSPIKHDHSKGGR